MSEQTLTQLTSSKGLVDLNLKNSFVVIFLDTRNECTSNSTKQNGKTPQEAKKRGMATSNFIVGN
jgi:hypothetical protein